MGNVRGFWIISFFCIFNTLSSFAQTNFILKGQVLDTNGNPLHFATITLDNQQSFFTNEQGDFEIKIKKEFVPFNISYINKRTEYIQAKELYTNSKGKYTLVDLSITLEEINIIAPQNKIKSGSNSAIVINKEAIIESQAFSLTDILNTIPGKATVRPNLDQAQTINLRGTFDRIKGGRSQQMNNSLGVAIIMDDINMSNDANMQTRNLTQFGLESGSSTGVYGYKILDLTYQGIDLREIPTENIESVEVVQGVASAKYGELTDGAIIINRQAGKTAYQLSTNINRGTIATSITKGFALPKKWGALNISMNYSKSNSDPRDKIQEYNRINQGLIWTKEFGNGTKNTLNFNYSRRLDGIREDKDDMFRRKIKVSDDFFRISNRIIWRGNGTVLKTLQINLNTSYGISNSYSQYLINKGPFPYANKDTIGVYRGEYLDGRYLAIEEIEGRPITVGATVNASTDSWGRNIEHQLSYGASLNYMDNIGKGTIYNPNYPMWFHNNNKNERPYDFRKNESRINFSFYLMDDFNTLLFSNTFKGNIGVRLDVQNNKISYQPRINLSYKYGLSSQLSFGAGISTKAPTLAHRYPAPTWLDFPLLDFFDNSDIKNSLYLVHTHKIEANNNHLKPSKSTQFELGWSSVFGNINTSINTYYKNNTDGFGTKREFIQIDVPEYSVIGTPEVGKAIKYEPTGNYKTYTDYFVRKITNSVKSKSFGIDWLMSTQKIKSLNMYIATSTSLGYSDYYDNNPTIEDVTNNNFKEQYGVYYIVFNPSKNKSLSLMSKFKVTYHIPKIGFIVNVTADVFWFSKGFSKNFDYAAEYLDSTMQPIQISLAEDIKKRISNTTKNYEQPPFYVINLNASKEIRKNIRIGVNTYNFFNIRINKEKELSDGSISVIKYNSPFSITGSLSIKF